MATRPKRPPPATARKGKARLAIVVARWNAEVTDRLAAGAEGRARRAGATVERFEVAGSFELPAAVALLAATGRYDAVVPLGCLVRGETPHFDVLARAVADGLMRLSLEGAAAVPFGVLTCDTMAQAIARAGAPGGGKGAEAVDAALSLVAIRQRAGAKASRSAATAPARSTSTKRRTSPGAV